METLSALTEHVHHNFIHKNQTLSVAESCTGGALSAQIVSKPGASHFFLGGIVAYANQAKINLLNVSLKDLEKCGSVSKEIALQMAQGALLKFHSDWAFATTGIAGPEGGSVEKPLGLVFCALVSKEKTFFWKKEFGSERSQVIQRTISFALERLAEI